MTIQWFTIVAQIINFLVLVYLLRRFLYGPIVNAMDERQQKFADQMHKTEEEQRQAEEEAARYRRKQQELEEEEADLRAEMRTEVEEQRERLLQQARTEVDERQRQWQHTLQREQDEFLHELRRQTIQHVYTVAEQVLTEVADAALDAQAVKSFLRHIQDLENGAWQDFKQSIREADQPIVVQSAFGLPQDLRQQIEDALQSYTEEHLDLRFETDPQLIAGVKLQAQNHVAAWHLDEYLETLTTRVQETMAAETHGVREEAEQEDTEESSEDEKLRGEERGDEDESANQSATEPETA